MSSPSSTTTSSFLFRDRFCIGDVMVVRAIKTIQEGDPINENYGLIFTQKCKADRQRILKERYWFDCRCQPCVENWPTIAEMTEDSLRFRCLERRCRKPLVVPVDTVTPFITCPSCKKSNNILKVNEKQTNKRNHKNQLLRTDRAD